MPNTIELGKWYEVQGRELAYYFLDHQRRGMSIGTTAAIRGKVGPLLEFIHELDKAYFKEPYYKIDQVRAQLEAVLESGRAGTGNQLPYFKDDRIRVIRRLDDDGWQPKDGPFAGSNLHLEIQHNEQYGGRYPASPNLSSRADMIGRVLESLGALEQPVIKEEAQAALEQAVIEETQAVPNSIVGEKAGPILRLLKRFQDFKRLFFR